MNCTPEKCPHRDLLDRARKACLSCNHIDPAGHGGTVSYDAAGERTIEREALRLDNHPRGQVTTLPADVEEKVADFFRFWCGLDTIDALLVLHVCNGGTPNAFGDYLARVETAIEKLRPRRENFRATAWLKFKTLCKRFAAVGKLQGWNKGHGGAIRKERENAETRALQGDLFEWGTMCGFGACDEGQG